MFETLLRPYDIQQTTALPTIGEVADKLKQSEIRREEKRLKQIASGHRGGNQPANGGETVPLPGAGGYESSSSSHGEKRKRDEDTEDAPEPGKRAKTEEEDNATAVEEYHSPTPKDLTMAESSALLKVEEIQRSLDQEKTAPQSLARSSPPPIKLNLSKVMPEVRGHTSYLTFACLLPSLPPGAVVDEPSSSAATPEKAQ